MTFYYKDRYFTEALEIAPEAETFRHGVGFAVDVYFNGHGVVHLDAHLEEIFSSMDQFGFRYVKIPFEEVAVQVAERNALAGRRGVVRIQYVMEEPAGRMHPLITAEPCSTAPDAVFRLASYPRHSVSYLSGHNTVSSMHRYLARQHASSRGADAAVLLDDAGRVLDSDIGALVFSDGKRFHTPRSQRVDHRTVMERVGRVLPLREAEVRAGDVPDFERVYVVGSVIGMRPVVGVDDVKFAPDEKTCELVTLKLL